MSDASSLFKPLAIRDVVLPNRIVMAPMTRKFSLDGVPGPNVAAYYRRRAEGETGLIVTEGVGIDHPAAVDEPNIPVMYGPAALAGWRQVVSEVHAAGGTIFPQLWHQGCQLDPRVARRAKGMSSRPSGIWGPLGTHSLSQDYLDAVMPPTRPMTAEDIQDVVAAFARSAANAMAVGFDGIALHGGHGYLLDTFLWDKTNLRTDSYGGDHAARTSFAVEVVKAIRAVIGAGAPIMFRFSHHKHQDYNARIADTPEQLEKMLVPLAEAGVDVFDGSTRRFQKPAFAGSTLGLAGWAKKLTGRLSMTVGGVGLSFNMPEETGNRAAMASAAVHDNIRELMERYDLGEFDLVGVGRSLLSDPAWPHHLRTGQPLRPFNQDATNSLS